MSLIQGNAGVPLATVAYSGAASGSVMADITGTYTIVGLANGTYTIIPALTTYTFTPSFISKTIASANILNVNFTAKTSSTNSSVIDSRTQPDSTVDIQDTQLYLIAIRNIVLPVDSRKAGSPVDCRASKTVNSRK